MNKISTATLFSKIIVFSLFLFPFQIFSQNAKELNIALQHLQQKRGSFQLTQQDISNYRISDLYTSQHNGVTHIYLQQQHEGIDVQNALININVLPNEDILNTGNRFISDLASKVNTIQPVFQPIDALQKVVLQFTDSDGHVLKLKERINDHHFVFENKGIALEPIAVKLLLELQNNGSVRLVWQVRLYQLNAQHFWNAKIDAVTGEMLSYFDEVVHCDFSHPNTNCEDAHEFPIENKNNTSTNTSIPFKSGLSPVMANSYHVFPAPLESAKHGGREIVVAPIDTTASPFGWHDTNGEEGAEFTITRGNNVHAYHDIFDQNKPVGDEPDGGALLEFDFPFTAANDTVYQKVDASTVNLFYWNNIIHDIFYHYGFDEVAGNFQANNYDKGGEANDYVRAEALDGGGSNNANFFTPDDGSRPRMQMFIWSGFNLIDTRNELIVTDTTGVDTTYEFRPAGFGSPLPTIPIVSELVLVDDGIENIHDACENIGNILEINGKIALMDRGNFFSCQYGSQILKAQNAGATAVIVCNTDTTNVDRLRTMNAGEDGDAITIPAVMVSFASCEELKMNLSNITISLGAPDFTIPSPGPTGIDSDFDNGVIVHEYGHGISNRLTGGPSASFCLRNMEQAGEGWSDWFALVMTHTASHTANTGRGIGTYSFGQSIFGDGIRQYRYSRDMEINPHLYSNIDDADVSVPHGVGSIWAVTIWDLYWNMIDIYGFDADLYHGDGGNNKTIQLVMDGLKLQPCSPTFLDSRDAILAADIANFDGAHQCMIWETFARRGMGASAAVGGVDRYDMPLDCQFRLKINKTAKAETMAGEVLTYTLEVKNDSPDTLYNITITDLLPDGVELVDGSMSCADFLLENKTLTIQLGDMLKGDSLVCTYDVLVDNNPFTYVSFEDDIENGIGDWLVTSAVGNQLWSVSNKSFAGEYAWFAQNPTDESDQYLTTANSFLITAADARFSFWHYVNTENNRDGGNVEISIDGGNTWDDLRQEFIQNGYNGLLINNIVNGQFGFTGDRDFYRESIIDLGDFQGEEVKFRFRFSSNQLEGGEGWYIDNVKLFGNYYTITNEACVSSDLEENSCVATTTIVNGDPTTPIDNVEDQLGVTIFPNPTEGKVFIKIEDQIGNETTTFKLVGMDGSILKTQKTEISNGIFEFDIDGFPKGIYFLQIQNVDTQIVRKVILQ